MSTKDSKLRLKERQSAGNGKRDNNLSSHINYNTDLLAKYKNYYIHIGTKNASFIKLAKMLKDLNIKNHMFFLKLYNPRLAEIDPYDEDLTDLDKAMIIEECRKNFWYFIREVVRIPVSGGQRRFILHRGNLALMWSLLRNLNTAIVLPRQNYKTVSTCCIYLWMYLLATSNSEFSLLNKKFEDSKNNLNRIKDIRETLPSYLRFIHPKDKNNIVYISSAVNKNKIVAKNSAMSAEEADKLGRGCTQAIQYYDEIAFLKYNDIIYGSSAPAQSEAALAASENGKPHHKLITTTPGDLSYKAGVWARKFILDKSAKFREEMYDWTKEEIEEYIENNSTNNFLYIFFTWKQIGRSHKWYKGQCRDVGQDPLKIRREIDCEWIRGSESAVFQEGSIRRARELCHEPIGSIHLLDGKIYVMNIYKEFDFKQPLLIGVDVASGEYKDTSTIVVCDSSTLEVLGVFQNNTVDSITLGQICHYLLNKIFTNAILCPERNNEGKAMIKYLLKTNIHQKIYWEEKEVIGEEKILTQTGMRQNSVKRMTRVYGIDTSTKTRPLMIDLIRPMLDDEPHMFHCLEIVEEIAGLERKASGKIEHSEATNDDITFGMLMCRYVWAYGTNLVRWNITKPREFTNLKNPNITPEELAENKYSIIYLNKTIDTISDDTTSYMSDNASEEVIRDYFNERKAKMFEEREIKSIEERKSEIQMNNNEIKSFGIDWDKPKKDSIERTTSSGFDRIRGAIMDDS